MNAGGGGGGMASVTENFAAPGVIFFLLISKWHPFSVCKFLSDLYPHNSARSSEGITLPTPWAQAKMATVNTDRPASVV